MAAAEAHHTRNQTTTELRKVGSLYRFALHRQIQVVGAEIQQAHSDTPSRHRDIVKILVQRTETPFRCHSAKYAKLINFGGDRSVAPARFGEEDA